MKSFLFKFFLILLILFFIAEHGLKLNQSESDGFSVSECSDEIEIQNDRYDHHRGWNGLDGNIHCENYFTSQASFQSAIMDRKSVRMPNPADYRQFWNGLYGQFMNLNTAFVERTFEPIFQKLDSMNLSARDQAKYLVSMVQDLPYAYILQSESCNGKSAVGGCLTGIRYGLLSPYEFLHSEKGDCDTRAVLLCMLLKKIGLNPKIAVSEVYAHAMLLVDLPSAGAYLEENGVRYYFWETTYPNWDIGMMPPDCNNLSNWSIVI